MPVVAKQIHRDYSRFNDKPRHTLVREVSLERSRHKVDVHDLILQEPRRLHSVGQYRKVTKII
jgi:hypothetical protein